MKHDYIEDNKYAKTYENWKDGASSNVANVHLINFLYAQFYSTSPRKSEIMKVGTNLHINKMQHVLSHS